ncbi:MAG: twin-arginine translocation signal domain-containing protein, partial [Spirosomataceae bacterium]
MGTSRRKFLGTLGAVSALASTQG